ncbi:Glycerophosphoryl diester phosphodiesterase [Actinopolymorpha cephalotaxi]|uniref:Glycerophosphoryl diester phosphodiesterase n=1 Tax=Actinopolymorpha cephalotaxi TaxID=504797 RepID=A0A1I2XC57_9ACTN|nr:glycerophosphodiester phosphodiesterase family protein [Actinopolymorpha cephalotaxi]NYH86107.1 glycerophosphoryl diester phosphodiesterase [Actinopolymorpha cephalotaxi]SFH09601.1 Glycerophosphoryl diester phosphodiesterase [Actinopolymorpha cephalotaxi]
MRGWTGRVEPGGSPVVIAHRGASGDAPENTVAAFTAALDQDADFIETDVRRTADGELVLFHDGDLLRTTDAAQVFPERSPWRLRDFTLDELRRLDAGSWNDDRFAGQRIPTLREAIDLVRGRRTSLLLELKRPGEEDDLAGEVAAALDHAAWSAGPGTAPLPQVVIGSIDREHAARYRRLRPEVTVGALVVRAHSPLPELEEIAGYADFIGTGQPSFPRDQVERLHGLGLGVLLNTSTAADVSGMLPYGIDGVVTDYPGRMVRALRGGESFCVEAESLLPVAQASGGLTAQGNRGMNGCKWSGDAQLLVDSSGPDNWFRATFDIDRPGPWSMALTVSKDRDGGRYLLSVDGEAVGPPVDTYRPAVARQTLTLPGRVLTEGRHVLEAVVVGRDPRSAGFALGLDVLEFCRKAA